MAKSGQRRLFKRAIIVTLTTLSLLTLTISFPASHSLLSPAVAQRFDPNSVWQQVYEQLPDIPLENQYINRETGDPVPNNTLVGRLIRYHIYIEGRPPLYRLDWKLTLADYLGVNEFIEPATYPSGDVLTVNPMQGDMAAIDGLSRAQRDALIQTIVDIFNTAYTPAQTEPQEENSTPASPQPAPSTTPSRPAPSPREPQPGDANLLLP